MASELIVEEKPHLGAQNAFLNRMEAETASLGDTDKSHLLKIIKEYTRAISNHTGTQCQYQNGSA